MPTARGCPPVACQLHVASQHFQRARKYNETLSNHAQLRVVAHELLAITYTFAYRMCAIVPIRIGWGIARWQGRCRIRPPAHFCT